MLPAPLRGLFSLECSWLLYVFQNYSFVAKIIEGHENNKLFFGVSLFCRYFCSVNDTKDMDLNFSGIIIGVATFLIIGLFHPLVIKAEYYIGVKSWWLFLLLGVVFSFASLLAGNLILSIILGVVAFSSFWGIGEVFQQKKRVEKGWFPANPKRKNK